MKESEMKKGFSNSQKWVFTFVVSLIILVLSYKIIFANYNIDLSTFSLSDFLALFLALFSIAISVAFYFKATDSSSRFYDNTYKFTKDIAELLVKIESSFGEKLKHLDEGYTSIRDKFDKFPSTTLIEEKVQTQEELEEVKKEYERKLQEKEKLLNDTLQKAHSNEADRKKIIQKLNTKEQELQIEKEKVHSLEKKLAHFNTNLDVEAGKSDLIESNLSSFLMAQLGSDFIKNASISAINNKFKNTHFSEGFYRELFRSNIIDESNSLSEDFILKLKRLAFYI